MSESAARETSLNSQIIEMELDLKSTKTELERLKTEKSGAMIELVNVKHQNSVLEAELKNLKGEVKEYRFRETRLLTDYSELEEENVLLQKQVGSVKASALSLFSLSMNFFTFLTFQAKHTDLCLWYFFLERFDMIRL